MSHQTSTRTVTSFEFRDYGVDHAQYFQGAGTAYTTGDDVYVGVGDTAREAADNAAEHLAESADLSDAYAAAPATYDAIEAAVLAMDDTSSAHADCTCKCEPGNDINECLGDCHEDCELNHYIGLFVMYEGN